jgi:hypothetical protein
MFVEQEHLPEHADRASRPAALASAVRFLARFDKERQYRSRVFSNLRAPFLAPKFRLLIEIIIRSVRPLFSYSCSFLLPQVPCFYIHTRCPGGVPP